MESTNQKELLDYMHGLPREWITPKKLHGIMSKDKEVSYCSVCRKMEILWRWGWLERAKDKNYHNGNVYRVTDKDAI